MFRLERRPRPSDEGKGLPTAPDGWIMVRDFTTKDEVRAYLRPQVYNSLLWRGPYRLVTYNKFGPVAVIYQIRVD
jgi:hypothetical protein